MAKNNTQAPEKDIVSFNQALELCSLGFDETTFCMYEIENKQLCLCYLDEEGLYMPQKDFHAPTKSQVFRWFREKYELFVDVYPLAITASDKIGYRYSYVTYNLIDGSSESDSEIIGHYTYEEAENACIDKLIEICLDK